MEILTTYEIKVGKKYRDSIHKKWVAFDAEVEEAIALYQHLKNHSEVQGDLVEPGEPMCKICNKTAKEIVKHNL